MPDLSVWPTDGAGPGGDGSVSSEARWRKMARLWTNSGVKSTADLAPTLAAGPTINVTLGQCWIDGHFCELTTPASVPVTAGPGILVVRFTPADNHAELVYRDGVQVPVQTDATWELPIALMSAGSMFDRRALAVGGEVSAIATADVTVSALNPTYGIVPGCQIVLWGVGRYLLTHSADIDVTAAGTAGNLLYAAPQFSGPITSGVPTTLRQFIDLNAVRRDVRTAAYPIEVTAPAAAVVSLGVCKGAANGTVVCRSTTGVTWLHARRIG